ncbi:MAG: hypothetical protein ACYTDY_10060 [Planctomycetota bacterium]|jgi:hypothetical protein
MRAVAVVSVLTICLCACTPAPSPAPAPDTAVPNEPAPEPPPAKGPEKKKPKEPPPAAFDGKTFLTREDAPKLDPTLTEEYMRKMERNNYEVIEHRRRDNGIHHYVVGGDMEMDVWPCDDAVEATARCAEGSKYAAAMKEMLESTKKVDHASLIKEKALVGSRSFLFEILRVDGNAIVKIGAHEGKYYVHVVFGGAAKDAKGLGPIRERAINAARYALRKLRKYR